MSDGEEFEVDVCRHQNFVPPLRNRWQDRPRIRSNEIFGEKQIDSVFWASANISENYHRKLEGNRQHREDD